MQLQTTKKNWALEHPESQLALCKKKKSRIVFVCGCEWSTFGLSDDDSTMKYDHFRASIGYSRRSRLVKNSSKIFCAFLACVCDFEMTVNSLRVTTHILCVLLFFGTCRELRARHVYLSLILLFLLLNSDFMTARNLSAVLNEIRRRQKGTEFIFIFISLPRSTAATRDFLYVFWCCFVYVYKNENAFFMPSYVFC